MSTVVGPACKQNYGVVPYICTILGKVVDSYVFCVYPEFLTGVEEALVSDPFNIRKAAHASGSIADSAGSAV